MDDLDRLIDSLSVEERQVVTARAGELLAAVNLRELRILAGKTQEDVSSLTGFKQNNISRLEKRSDMKLSTLRDYVESLGGRLRIEAEIGGRKVDISAVASKPRRGAASG